MKLFLLILSILLSTNLTIAQQGNQVKIIPFTSMVTDTTFQNTGETGIIGIISDIEYQETLPFAAIKLSKDSIFIAGVFTAIDGLYAFKNLTPGTYDIEITYVGYVPLKITDVLVKSGISSRIDVGMRTDVSFDNPIGGYYVPNINRVIKSTLSGVVVEQESKDPVIYGSVTLYQNDVLLTGVETDFHGRYVIENLSAGIYNLEVSYVGLPSKRITGVHIVHGKMNTVNIEMNDSYVGCGHTVVIGYEIPLYDPMNLTSGKTLTSPEMKRRPFTRN